MRAESKSQARIVSHDLFLQPSESPQGDGLSRDDVEKVAKVSERIADVLVHYPSDRNQKYLRHHHMTVVRLHPAEGLFRRF